MTTKQNSLGINKPGMDIYNEENSDFGVYICEARNDLDSYEQYGVKEKLESPFTFYHSNVVRRYIKLNPNGPPLVRAVQTASAQMNVDELSTLIMMTSPAQISSLYQVRQFNFDFIVAETKIKCDFLFLNAYEFSYLNIKSILSYLI